MKQQIQGVEWIGFCPEEEKTILEKVERLHVQIVQKMIEEWNLSNEEAVSLISKMIEMIHESEE
jgi:hypothetical protein